MNDRHLDPHKRHMDQHLRHVVEMYDARPPTLDLTAREAELFRQKLALIAQVAVLRVAIERALADSESQAGGWGPDVTVCSYLRQALKDTE